MKGEIEIGRSLYCRWIIGLIGCRCWPRFRKMRYYFLALITAFIVIFTVSSPFRPAARDDSEDYSTVLILHPQQDHSRPLSSVTEINQGNLTNIIQWSLKYQQLLMNNDNSRRLGKKNNSNNDRIFFHETSGRTQLSFKETCVVESAALHNPQRPVEVFIQPQQQHQSAGINYSEASSASTWLQVLDHYKNVQVIVIDDEELYFKDSPLEEWYRKGQWRESPYRLQHMADYIRMISMKKQGGMYLDLDVLTVKAYDRHKFWNFVTVPSNQYFVFVNGVFHLEQNHPLIDLILEKQAEEYEPKDYIFNGPEALTSAVIELCNASTAAASPSDPNNKPCATANIKFMKHPYFFPIPSPFSYLLFHQPLTDDERGIVSEFFNNINRSYGVHFYNSVNPNQSVDLSPNSTQMFARLAAQHCPVTLSYGHNLISF